MTRLVVPAIHHTDTSETLEYIQGWNDCRQAMLAKQPDHHDPIGVAQDRLIAEQALAHCEAGPEYCQQCYKEAMKLALEALDPFTTPNWPDYISEDKANAAYTALREALAKQPAQRTWVGLMRGVRVEGDTVVITAKGGNDAARELCGALLEEKNT